MKKTVIIGAGHVGSHAAMALAFRSLASEIALIDIDGPKAEAQALDLSDAFSLFGAQASVYAGGYEDLRGAALVIVCAGFPRKPGQTRLDVMGDSLTAAADIAPKLAKTGYSGPVLCITNPADVIVNALAKLGGFDHRKLFSSGTALDTLRLRAIVADKAGISPESVHGYVLGEHGDSSVPALSSLTAGPKPFKALGLDVGAITQEVRMRGMDIINGKASTEFGIASAIAGFASAILYDEKAVFAASAYLTGEYGAAGFYAGTPCLIGAGGVEEVYEIALDEREEKGLAASFEVIRDYNARAEAALKSEF